MDWTLFVIQNTQHQKLVYIRHQRFTETQTDEKSIFLLEMCEKIDFDCS